MGNGFCLGLVLVCFGLVFTFLFMEGVAKEYACEVGGQPAELSSHLPLPLLREPTTAVSAQPQFKGKQASRG